MLRVIPIFVVVVGIVVVVCMKLRMILKIKKF